MVQKVPAAQQMLQPPAPIQHRKRRIRLVQNRFDRESNVGDVSVDHPKLERANDVVITGVHSLLST
ncbi:hypothetical protein [Caballeronia sp. S22]|uniref:hypothetical protein n=1 Tax=Caballeronia sp. S22 TaxID=3137182 RepID=UPI003530C140